jgi:hypothetical protein
MNDGDDLFDEMARINQSCESVPLKGLSHEIDFKNFDKN